MKADDDLEPIPRLRCHGKTFDHPPAFLALRKPEPALLECPICGAEVELQ